MDQEHTDREQSSPDHLAQPGEQAPVWVFYLHDGLHDGQRAPAAPWEHSKPADDHLTLVQKQRLQFIRWLYESGYLES